MKGIRSLIFLVAMLLITGFYSLRILWRCRRQTSQDVAALGRGWGQANLRALNRLCRLSYRVEGLERIPSGAVVYLCKHQSAWETMALWAILPIQQKSWILKRELLHIPLFGWALRCFNPIAIDRDHPRQALRQVLAGGVEALRAGRSVIVFPEGTRVSPGERGKYASSGAELAVRAGVPLVPIAHNAGVYWRRRSFIKQPGCIQVVIGSTLATSGRSAPDLIREVEQWIEKTVAGLPGGTPPGH